MDSEFVLHTATVQLPEENDNDQFDQVPLIDKIVEVPEDSAELVQQFAFDSAMSSSALEFIKIKAYLNRSHYKKSVADTRRSLADKVPPEYLSNTIILRAMCELEESGQGTIIAGTRTYWFLGL